MGADLYINSVHKKNKATFDPLFYAAVEVRDAGERGIRETRRHAIRFLSADPRAVHNATGHVQERLREIGAFLDSPEGEAFLERQERAHDDLPDYRGLVVKLAGMTPKDDIVRDKENGYRPTQGVGYVGTAQILVDLFFDAMFDSSGYFRDPYNGSNVLGKLGLSWWNDVAPLLNKKHELPLAKVKRFRNQVRDATITAPTIRELRKNGCVCKDANERQLWVKYWERERQALVAFLDKCLELKERPYMSL